MKRWMIMFGVVGLLAGCSSTPTKEQDGAKVEDRSTDGDTALAPGDAESSGYHDQHAATRWECQHRPAKRSEQHPFSAAASFSITTAM